MAGPWWELPILFFEKSLPKHILNPHFQKKIGEKKTSQTPKRIPKISLPQKWVGKKKNISSTGTFPLPKQPPPTPPPPRNSPPQRELLWNFPWSRRPHWMSYSEVDYEALVRYTTSMPAAPGLPRSPGDLRGFQKNKGYPQNGW